MALGAVSVQHIYDRKIPHRVLGAQYGDFLGQMAVAQPGQCLVHTGDRPAEHGLHGIGDKSIFDGNDPSSSFRCSNTIAPLPRTSKVSTVLPRNSIISWHSRRQVSTGSRSR